MSYFLFGLFHVHLANRAFPDRVVRRSGLAFHRACVVDGSTYGGRAVPSRLTGISAAGSEHHGGDDECKEKIFHGSLIYFFTSFISIWHTGHLPAESYIFSPSHFMGHWYCAFALASPQDAANIVRMTAQERNIAFISGAFWFIVKVKRTDGTRTVIGVKKSGL
jgi:hypothetical protein